MSCSPLAGNKLLVFVVPCAGGVGATGAGEEGSKTPPETKEHAGQHGAHTLVDQQAGARIDIGMRARFKSAEQSAGEETGENDMDGLCCCPGMRLLDARRHFAVCARCPHILLNIGWEKMFCSRRYVPPPLPSRIGTADEVRLGIDQRSQVVSPLGGVPTRQWHSHFHSGIRIA